MTQITEAFRIIEWSLKLYYTLLNSEVGLSAVQMIRHFFDPSHHAPSSVSCIWIYVSHHISWPHVRTNRPMILFPQIGWHTIPTWATGFSYHALSSISCTWTYVSHHIGWLHVVPICRRYCFPDIQFLLEQLGFSYFSQRWQIVGLLMNPDTR